MKNKSLLLGLCMMMAVGVLGLSYTSATSFQISGSKVQTLSSASITNRIVPVHFTENGNNFGWFLYFSNLDNLTKLDQEKLDAVSVKNDGVGGTTIVAEGEQLNPRKIFKWLLPEISVKITDISDYTFSDAEPILDEDWGRALSGLVTEGDTATLEVELSIETTKKTIEDIKIVGGTTNSNEGDTQLEEVYIVTDWTNTLECNRQVQWFYYNAERWERLWPLDEETFSGSSDLFTGLNMTWWIYTLCRKAGYADAVKCCETPGDSSCDKYLDVDGDGAPDLDESRNLTAKYDSCVKHIRKMFPENNWYFGMVWHKYKSQKFGLVMGLNYNKDVPWVRVNGNLENTFFRWHNQIPLGFVYDYNGWIWFAGCEIVGKTDPITLITDRTSTLNNLIDHQRELEDWFDPNWDWGIVYSGWAEVECNKIWTAWDSLIKLLVEGLIWMNKESDLWVIWNQTDSKMQYFSSADINSATLLNYVKKRSEILCRWKWKKISDAKDLSKFNSNFPDDVACIDANKEVVDTDITSLMKNAWKTLIVKNGNVTIDSFSGSNDDSYYDIFVNGGNLIINEESDTSKFKVFTKEWFLSNTQVSDFASAVESSISTNGNYTWDDAAVWIYIRANLIVDGKVMRWKWWQDSKFRDKYFIYWKFTTKNSFTEYENLFAWRCSNGFVSGHEGDASVRWYCPPSIMSWGKYLWHNPYESASLVVIDQNYDSPLLW